MVSDEHVPCDVLKRPRASTACFWHMVIRFWLFAIWISLSLWIHTANWADADQPARMQRLIWVFPIHACAEVSFQVNSAYFFTHSSNTEGEKARLLWWFMNENSQREKRFLWAYKPAYAEIARCMCRLNRPVSILGTLLKWYFDSSAAIHNMTDHLFVGQSLSSLSLRTQKYCPWTLE